MNDWGLSEIERRLVNLLRIGVVDQLSSQTARVRVKIGANLTTWLPFITGRAGEDRSWHPPEPGEQVLVLSPSGSLNDAVVLAGLFQLSYPAPVDTENKHHMVYKDGTVVEYDREAHHMKINCVGSVEITGATELNVTFDGQVSVTAPTTVIETTQTHNGDVTINGNLVVSGSADVGTTVTAGTDCIGGGKSLVGHTHTDSVGGSTTPPL